MTGAGARATRLLGAGAVACGVWLSVAALPAAGRAPDGQTIAHRYADVAVRASVVTTKVNEAPKRLQSRAVLVLFRAQALGRSLNVTAPGVYPTCETSLRLFAGGSTRVSQGASLIRLGRQGPPGTAATERVRRGRARIAAGMNRLDAGLAQAGACWAELYGAPNLPTPGTGTPEGSPPPVIGSP